MRRARPLWIAAACLAAAGPAAARPADGPQRLGDPSAAYLFSLDPALATAASGRSVALVAGGRRLTVRLAAPGHPFASAQRLPTFGGTPAVATADGLTSLAWTHFDRSYIAEPDAREEDCCARLRAATLDAAGRPRRPRELSSPGFSVEEARLVVRGRRAAVAWVDGRGVRVSTTARSGARVGAPKTLVRGADQLLGVALADAGPRVFVLTHSSVVELWRSGGHTRRRALGRFMADALPVNSAVSPAGALLIASTAPYSRRSGTTLLVAHRRPGGRLRRHVVAYHRRVSIAEMAVTLAPTGRGLVALTQPNEIAIRTVGDDGRLGRAHVVRGLRTRRSYPSDLALATNAAGAGVLGALVGTVSGNDHERTRAVAWALAPGGRPLGRHVLSFARETFGPQEGVTVTIDAAGRRRVAWAEDAGLFAVRLP
jgi:hypothetical protein